MEVDSQHDDEVARAKRHSRLVKLLRVVLPASSACVVVLYGLSAFRAAEWADVLPSLPIPTILPDKLTMDNPRYKGFTDDGGSYLVMAKTASQDFKNPGVILLEGISGELVDAKDDKTLLAATHGKFDSRKNILDLSGQIEIGSTDGMRAKLKSAKILTKSGMISSQDPVFVAMRSNTLRANRLTLWQKKKEVYFEGDVKARLEQTTPASVKKASTAVPAPKPAKKPGLFAGSRSPVDITSETLKVANAENLAIFSGQVNARQDDAALKTSELEVHFEASKKPKAKEKTKPKKGISPLGGGAQKIEQIVAKYPIVMTRGTDQRVTSQKAQFLVLKETAILTGKVVIVSGQGRRVTSDRAFINQSKETVLLEGNVILQQSKNSLRGRRLFVDRRSGKMKLTSPPGSGAGPGRVLATLYRDVKPGAAKSSNAKPKKAQKPGVASFKTDPSAPIHISADSLDVDNGAHAAVFHGGVVAKQGTFKIESASLTAHFEGQINVSNPTASGNNGGADKGAGKTEIKKITAKNNVLVTSQTGQTAKGDWAEFDVVENVMELGGAVSLKQGKSLVRGTRLKIDMATGLSVIETGPAGEGGGWASSVSNDTSASNKESAPPAGFNARGGRPSAVFFPSQFDKKKKK